MTNPEARKCEKRYVVREADGSKPAPMSFSFLTSFHRVNRSPFVGRPASVMRSKLSESHDCLDECDFTIRSR